MYLCSMMTEKNSISFFRHIRLRGVHLHSVSADRQHHEYQGSVAQLYSALDFGSSGCGLESLRGHSSGDLVKIDRISAFYFLKSI